MSGAPVRFVERARRALEDEGSLAALRRGVDRFTAHRLQAAAEYPAMEPMRDRARAIRLHVLENLDRYLDRFAEAVEAVGGEVRWAANAEEANAHVVDIARSEDVRLAVKSKSMVTEEIALNAALEAAEVEVVETDLGEFIVQLAHDHPSHIIAPVLHWDRASIGRLFAEKLGVPYTDDPLELNAIARRYLRSRFLEADMGISGANFGVAQTGTICLVTNEGNGRMVTSLPRVHVAVMGMERLVPALGDLAVMLEVLARSATGQRLSSYTSLITGPRRPGDPDGPERVVVVIVDNGRSDVLGSDVAEILACIRCGACLNACPVYRAVGGHAYGSVYPGPVGAVLSPAMFGLDAYPDLPYASSLCAACREACPVRIDIPELLLRLRDDVADEALPSWVRRGVAAYAAAAVRPRLFRALLRTGGLVGRIAPGDDWVRSLPSHGAAWTDHRDLPRPAPRPFHARWRDRKDVR